MSDEERNDHPDFLGRLITVLLRQPWLELVGKAWKILRKLIAGWSHQGGYEVLEYDLTLELKDRGGK